MTQSTQQHRPPARLALEDGTIFHGTAFGACDKPLTSAGEVVFNTAMCGYQEALTDPSYAGQILTMTAPMIGNYGIAIDDDESSRPQVAGFVIRELSRVRSNYRAVTDLSSWLSETGVLGIEGVDTRALVLHIRRKGALRGVVSCDPTCSDQQLVDRALAAPVMSGSNLAATVSVSATSNWKGGLGDWSTAPTGSRQGEPLRVLALDCGGKRNIYRHLADLGCEVDVSPHSLSPAEIRAANPDGLFISNGPGDPDAVNETVETLRDVLADFPTFGICLGHQLLALALGAKTYKLKFGHRGANQPVRNLLTDTVEITSQNHGFAVDIESLAAVDAEMTHVHLNDGTLAGFRHLSLPLFSVQYHPEASPGPHDSAYLFDCFVSILRSGRPIDAQTMRSAQNRRRVGVNA